MESFVYSRWQRKNDAFSMSRSFLRRLTSDLLFTFLLSSPLPEQLML